MRHIAVSKAFRDIVYLKVRFLQHPAGDPETGKSKYLVVVSARFPEIALQCARAHVAQRRSKVQAHFVIQNITSQGLFECAGKISCQ